MTLLKSHNKRTIMKKTILSIMLVMFVSSAFAGSCPMMANNTDAKIAEAH
jgi:hypothetical protein